MNEAEIAGGCFVVARCQTAGALEVVEAALHPVSQGVCDAINKDGFFPIDLAWNDGGTATLSNDTTNVIAVVATVGNEHSGFGKIVINERIEPFESAELSSDRRNVSRSNAGRGCMLEASTSIRSC